MSFVNCFKGFRPADRDNILSRAEVYQKNGMSDKEAIQLSVREYSDEIINQLDDIFGQLKNPKKESGDTPPPTNPPTNEEDSGFEKQPGKKSVLNRALEGQGSQDEKLKAAIEKYGLQYEPETGEGASASAKAFIEQVGFDAALEAVEKNSSAVSNENRAHVYAQLIDQVNNELENAETDEERDALIEFEAKLVSDLSDMATKAGQEIAALAYIYQNSDFYFKASNQVNEYKKRNNGQITPEIEAKFAEWEKQLTDLKAERDAAAKRAADAEMELAIKNIKESTARAKKGSTRTQQKIREARNERASLKEQFKKEFFAGYNPAKSGGQLNAAIPGAQLVAYAVKVANTYIKEGIARAEEVIAKTKEFFEKELGYKLTDDETTSITQKIDERLDQIDEKEGKVRVSHKAIRDIVESGVDNINDLVAKVKESIKDRHPDVTDREIRDAITGYGKTINPSKDQIEQDIRKMVRIGRIISAMEDVANRKRPLRSGRQRDAMDAQERALQKDLKAAMKELPADEETEARQLKTSLDAVKARLRNRREDLEREIETGKKSAKAKGVTYDAEAKALQDEIVVIEEIHDAIFYKRDDDATKIENVLAATEKAIQNVTDRISKNELESKKVSKVTSPDITASKERLTRAKEWLKALQQEAGIPERKRLERAKVNAQKRLDDYRERLRNNDFAKAEPKQKLIKDDELTKIEAEIFDVKERFFKEQYKIELANRSKFAKAVDMVAEVWGLTRVVMATGEFSFFFLQNWVYSQAHPITAIKALGTAFSHFGSQEKSDNFLKQIRAQEYYKRMKETKLAIAETDVKMEAREEMFIGSWGNKVWDLIGQFITINGTFKGALAAWKKVNPIKAFERAGTGFLNTVRVQRYLEGEEMLRTQGKNYTDNSNDYKEMADTINTLTGRGSLGTWGNRNAKALSFVFFSPRNWSSILQQTLLLPVFLGRKFTRNAEGKLQVSVSQKMAVADMMKAVAMTTAILMLIDAANDDDDKDAPLIELDPRSSDFGKVKIGKTRIDPWGGRIQQITLASRLITGSIKSEKGKINELGDGRNPTTLDLIGRQAKNKLAPSTALAYKFLNKHNKKISGEDVWVDEYGNELFKDPETNVYPIYWQSIKELWTEQPETVAAFIIAISFLGVGSNTYDTKELARQRREFYKEKRKAIKADQEED